MKILLELEDGSKIPGSASGFSKPPSLRGELCMVGRVRTKEKCSRCGGKFAGEPLACPVCLITPRRYFVHFHWKGQSLKLYTGKDGHLLDSWERAYRLLTAMRNDVDLGKFDPKDYVPKEVKALRFDNYVSAWLERRGMEQERGHISKSYLKSCREYARNYFLPFFGKKVIRDLQASDLEDFRNQLPPALSAKTIFNLLGVLRKLFRDANRRRDILVLPEFPRVELTEPVTRWLTEEEQERILARIKNPTYRAFFLFLMKQGCRPGEARALKWHDMDLKNEEVVIRAAMDLGEYRPHTKERDVRYQPLHSAVLEALRRLPRSLNGYVFVNRAGRPLSATRIRMQWRYAALAAGLDIGCYQGTKHSLASQAINRGVPERLLQDFLGHRDPRSTRRYAKTLTKTLKEVWGETGD
ncbi:MAG: tyrosine-type recombinase/integrase [Desulfocucumaceae bacterium]